MNKLFNELKDMKSAYERKLNEDGEVAVKEVFKDIFDQFPEIRLIMWTQYTPYFNDGDPCYFSVHDFDVAIGTVEDIQKQIETTKLSMKEAGDAGDYKKAQNLRDDIDELVQRLNNGDEYEYGDSVSSLRHSSNPREVEIASTIRNLEKELPDDVMKIVFGDHVRVKATRQGFDVEEFSHD